MTTDLRAALRDAAEMLARVKPIDLNVGDDPHGLAARCRALADAPPTVAELLVSVDFLAGRRWIEFWARGQMMRVRAHCGALQFIVPTLAAPVEVPLFSGGSTVRAGMRWTTWNPDPSDLTQPATLVEVSP